MHGGERQKDHGRNDVNYGSETRYKELTLQFPFAIISVSFSKEYSLQYRLKFSIYLFHFRFWGFTWSNMDVHQRINHFWLVHYYRVTFIGHWHGQFPQGFPREPRYVVNSRFKPTDHLSFSIVNGFRTLGFTLLFQLKDLLKRML